MEQECLTVALTFMIEVPVSAYDWVPRAAEPSVMADTITRLRVLWLHFDFIIRSFY